MMKGVWGGGGGEKKKKKRVPGVKMCRVRVSLIHKKEFG